MQVTVQVVTDNNKLFESMHFVDHENAASRTNVFDKLVEKLFASRKITPPPQPWVGFEKCTEVQAEALQRQNDVIVVYDKSDYKSLKQMVAKAGFSGAFIICTDTMDEGRRVADMFAAFSTVDVITRETCQSDKFTYVLLSAILKRALREAGFLD